MSVNKWKLAANISRAMIPTKLRHAQTERGIRPLFSSKNFGQTATQNSAIRYGIGNKIKVIWQCLLDRSVALSFKSTCISMQASQAG